MMRFAVVLLLAVPAAAFGQTAGVVEDTETLLYVLKLQDKETGGFKVTPDGKPSLRACNGAVKAVKALGMKAPPAADKVAAFVMSCYDPKAGAFAEPGGKPDVAITSVGVMAAVEVGVPKEKFRGAMDYLKANAKTFEDVRIAAAAVEAWGVKDCPFDLKPWHDTADQWWTGKAPPAPAGDNDRGRQFGSLVAMHLRLGRPAEPGTADWLRGSQWADGGWGQAQAKMSDLESTYRVVRAFHLLKDKPDVAKVRAFIAKCRNADGGYGVKPGEASSMSGTYYAVTIRKWLDGMK